MAGFSTFGANKLLDAILNNDTYVCATPYVSLHTADPGLTGTSEVTGGSYARQLGSFSSAAARASASDADIDFAGMPAATITHVGIWDAVTAGNFIWGGALTASKAVGAGETLHFPSGDVDLDIA